MRLIETLVGRVTDRPPFWFMRQAGRYLPEYRALREKAGDFLTLCYTPEWATEVTLQPIRRFGMDAAIIFSDILVIPQALGRAVHFEKGEGPRVDPVTSIADLDAMRMEKIRPFLTPVYEALRRTRSELPKETALIGFAGAPWTLLCYMLEGRGKTQFPTARGMVYRDPTLVRQLTDLLAEAVAEHLVAQVEAGANALQLFDSWAGLCPAPQVEALIIEPARRIVEMVKARCPGVPIIAFPRGLGMHLPRFVAQVRPDGLSLDTETPLDALGDVDCAIQGNLDPLLLAADSNAAIVQAETMIEVMRGTPYIVNLGHGIVPETPVAHMEMLCRRLTSTG